MIKRDLVSLSGFPHVFCRPNRFLTTISQKLLPLKLVITRIKIILKKVPLLVGSLAFVSCTAPAPSSPFVDGVPIMSRDKSTSFQRSWMKPGVSFDKYRQVYIAPTNTDYTKIKLAVLNSRRLLNGGYQKDIVREGVNFQKNFSNAFEQSKKRNWVVVDQFTKDRRTLKVETALVQMTPSRVELEAAGYVVPGVSLLNTVAVASEVKISDARTGDLLAVFADRQKSPFALIDLSKFSYYKADRNVIRDWARQTERWIERGGSGAQIYESLPFLPVAW